MRRLFKKAELPKQKQYLALGILSAAILVGTITLTAWDSSGYERFLGNWPPVAVFTFIVLLSWILLPVLFTRYGLQICHWRKSVNSLRLSPWVLLLAGITILVDVLHPFPPDINILFPQSLLFYPTIAFLVEIFFHVLPLAVLVLVLTRLRDAKQTEKTFFISIAWVALLEPTFQLFFMETFPLWASVTIWLNLYIFNLLQLRVFQKHGFFAMYTCRLIYYLVWHILWGMLRLEVLFS